jgi:hypothetical protein
VIEAREAGLDDESIESLLRVTLRATDSADGFNGYTEGIA